MAGVCLFELDRSWDLGPEDELAEELAELPFEVFGHVVLLHHRQHDPADPEGLVVQEPPDLGDVRLELAEAEDAEEARGDRDQEPPPRSSGRSS